jgi:hypothetical protein
MRKLSRATGHTTKRNESPARALAALNSNVYASQGMQPEAGEPMKSMRQTRNLPIYCSDGKIETKSDIGE